MSPDETNDFEKFPGSANEASAEQAKQAEVWHDAMVGAPEFGGEGIGTFEEPKSETSGIGIVTPEAPNSAEVAGDQFGIAKAENEYYGEAKSSGIGQEVGAQDVATDIRGAEDAVKAEQNSESTVATPGVNMNVPMSPVEEGAERDDGIADAAALINYGLNAAAMQIGVEAVVQKIKGFDASGREDPIGDLYTYLGVEMPNNYQNNGRSQADSVKAFQNNVNAPMQQKTPEGAFKALDDMKELIAEVEGADPRYEALRQGAKASGKGYFEFAVSNYGKQGLTELFEELAKQREGQG